MERSKRYQREKEKIDSKKVYSFDEALKLIKENSKLKFNAAIEVHFHLGIDPKKADQAIRGTAFLPHGTGKKKRIAAFVTPEKEKEAKEAGADIVGGEELIKKIKQTGKCDFQIAVAEPAMMKNLGQIAKILGQKGLMPNPKSETVSSDIKTTIEDLQKGKISFKSDEGGNLHQIIGKTSFEDSKLRENFQAFLEVVKKAKLAEAKGVFLKSVTICSSMGPGIRVAL